MLQRETQTKIIKRMKTIGLINQVKANHTKMMMRILKTLTHQEKLIILQIFPEIKNSQIKREVEMIRVKRAN